MSVNNLGRGGPRLSYSLSRAPALPARQASGMRLDGLRAPTRTDAPTEPAVGFCESGNSIRSRQVSPSHATRCSPTRSGRRGLAPRHTRHSDSGTAVPADFHVHHSTNTSASCNRHPQCPSESLATPPCMRRMSRTCGTAVCATGGSYTSRTLSLRGYRSYPRTRLPGSKTALQTPRQHGKADATPTR